jgi:hypothetical protein
MKKLYIAALAFIAITAAPAYTMNGLVTKVAQAQEKKAVNQNFCSSQQHTSTKTQG